MNTGNKAVLLLTACLLLSRTPFACSSFVFMNKGYPVFGTNYDNRFAPGLLFINKRNVRKTAWETGTTGRAASWVSTYGSVTIACAGYQIPWAGMNEAGLVFSTMALSGTRCPAPDERPQLTGAFWMQHMLDTCATVEDILKAAERIRIIGADDHYLVCDRAGRAATLEFLDGRTVVHKGESMPVKVLTNSPYAECLDKWQRKIRDSEEPYDSVNRFARLADRLAAFKDVDANASTLFAFGLLENVSASITRWSLVFDLGNRVMHFRTFKNSKVRSVELRKLDFSCATPALMLDAHASLSGDISGSFRPYSHETSLNHLLSAIRYFRSNAPEDVVRTVLRHLEAFPCEPEKK